MPRHPEPFTVALTSVAVGGLLLTSLIVSQRGVSDVRLAPEVAASVVADGSTGAGADTGIGAGTGAGAATAGATNPGAAAAGPTPTPGDATVLADGVAPVDAPAHTGRGDAPRASPGWVVETAAATAIPEPAVRAYADAALASGVTDPGCGLGWTTLAALGLIESAHGSHGGSTLGADGRPFPPVIGPALDGVGVAAIPATADGTLLHGDALWEHAVGPMQMLPSTWQRWAADGDDDGAADPHDLDDAALGAAGYLCAGDRDLRTGEGWWAAVFSYNHSDDYVRDVLAVADGYAADLAGP